MNPELIGYYLNLLIIQYKTKPNALALLTAIVTKMIIADLIFQVRDGYNIYSASGPQLDVLAKYAGISREVSGIPFYDSGFGYILYSETPPVYPMGPYGTYLGNPPPSEVFFTYSTSAGSYEMSDVQLQQVLSAKILLNYSRLSLADYDTALSELFGNSYDIIEGTQNPVNSANTGFGFGSYSQDAIPAEIGPYALYGTTPPVTEIYFQYSSLATVFNMSADFVIMGSGNVMTAQNAQAAGIFSPPMGVQASITFI